MNQSTLTESTFKLYKVIRNSDGSTTLQQITDVGVTPSGDGFSVKLDPYPLEPSKLLAANTRYKVVITTGAKDVAGDRSLGHRQVAAARSPRRRTGVDGSVDRGKGDDDRTSRRVRARGWRSLGHIGIERDDGRRVRWRKRGAAPRRPTTGLAGDTSP